MEVSNAHDWPGQSSLLLTGTVSNDQGVLQGLPYQD